jgi:hypothetical protein
MNNHQETGQGDVLNVPVGVAAGEPGFIVQIHNDMLDLCKRLRAAADVETGTVAFRLTAALGDIHAARAQIHPMLGVGRK